MSEKETKVPHLARTPSTAADRGRRRRFRHPAVLLQLLPGHGDSRGSHPRLRPESPAVRHRPPGRQGEPADRDELLHGQAAPDGPGHDDPAARGDLRLDRAGRPPPRDRASPRPIPSPAGSAPRASSSNPGLPVPRRPSSRGRSSNRAVCPASSSAPRPIPSAPPSRAATRPALPSRLGSRLRPDDPLAAVSRPSPSWPSVRTHRNPRSSSLAGSLDCRHGGAAVRDFPIVAVFG